MAITTISIGTAGTQSGDKVRDAFSIVNNNFSNFQLNDLKGYYKYFNSGGWEIAYESWATSAALLSNIPAGTYLVFLSARMASYDGNGFSCPVLLLADDGGNDLGIQLIGDAIDTYSRNESAIVQITKSASFGIKLKYKCLNIDTVPGALVDNIVILLQKVG